MLNDLLGVNEVYLKDCNEKFTIHCDDEKAFINCKENPTPEADEDYFLRVVSDYVLESIEGCLLFTKLSIHIEFYAVDS